jgi:tetratricopeptide (TPR) repeat protein
MYYIKIYLCILLAFIITACSNSPITTDKKTQVARSSDSSLQELVLYKDAIIALNKNELAKAKELFIQMTEHQPNIAGSWANLALIEIKQNNFPQAEIYAKTALEKNPKMPQALNLLGYLAQKKGKINVAKSFYMQAISNQSDYSLAHYNLALLYDVYLGDIAKAIKHYQLYLAYNTQKDVTTESWLEGLKATMAANNS